MIDIEIDPKKVQALLESLSEEQIGQLERALAVKLLSDFALLLDPESPFSSQLVNDWEKLGTFHGAELKAIFMQLEGSFADLMSCSKNEPPQLLWSVLFFLSEQICGELSILLESVSPPNTTDAINQLIERFQIPEIKKVVHSEIDFFIIV
jgi:hypothetical protein